MYILSAPIAWLLGIRESGVRLFLTVLAGYPIAFHYHKKYVKEKPDATPRERNHYILWTGILLSLLFNVFNIFHSFVTIGISYYICYMGDQFHNRKAGAIAVWTFNLIYLLIGYVFAASDSYDINWTTTQCVLCLRLMGFSTDFMDGGAILNRTLEQQQEEEKKQLKVKHPHSFGQDAPLKSLPDFEQVLGYCFFPSAFLIGPQFSFSLYRRFLSGPYNGIKQEDLRYTEQIQSNYVKRCLSIGLFYILVLQLVGTSYPTTHLLTEEYRSQGFLTRLVDFWICGKMVYVKYLGVWLLTEGTSSLFGISYEGDDEHEEPSFAGLANARPLKFEFATSIEHLVPTFNINTNLWIKHYVFKRLRFLGNKDLSQLGAFVFLAIWHGYHFNYFHTFALEFSFIFVERLIRKRIYFPIVQPLFSEHKHALWLWKVIAWLSTSFCFNYAIVGFDLLTFRRGVKAYNSIYWLGHLGVIAVIVGYVSLGNPKKHHKSS